MTIPVLVRTIRNRFARSAFLYASLISGLLCFLPQMIGQDLNLEGSILNQSMTSVSVKIAATAALASTCPLLIDFVVDALYETSKHLQDIEEKVAIIVALYVPSIILLRNTSSYDDSGDTFVTAFYFQFALGVGALFSMMRKYNPVLISARYLVLVYLSTAVYTILAVFSLQYEWASTIHAVAAYVLFGVTALKIIVFFYELYLLWRRSKKLLRDFYRDSSHEVKMTLRVFSTGFLLFGVSNLVLPNVTSSLDWASTSVEYICWHQGLQTMLTFIINGLPGSNRARSINMENKLEQKRTFIRYISHEIRTPLNTLSMGLSLLEAQLNEAKASIPSTVFENIEAMQSSCQDAVGTLNELIDFEKLESGLAKIDKSVVEPLIFLEGVLAPFTFAAEQSKVHLIVSKPAVTGVLDYRLHIDERKVAQVFRNLLSNAIKFTPSGGDISIKIEIVDADDAEPHRRRSSIIRSTSKIACDVEQAPPRRRRLRVEVVDSGFGIAKENLGRLFREVVQFEAKTQQAGGGSGLGLWISKKIIDMHDGKIWVASEGLGHGCRFGFELDLTHLSALEEGMLAQAVRAEGSIVLHSELLSDLSRKLGPRQRNDNGFTGVGEMLGLVDTTRGEQVGSVHTAAARYKALTEDDPLTVLIVDDSAATRKMVCRSMEMKRYQCVQATDGLDALEKYQQAQRDGVFFDVIMLDNCMPNMDGPACCRRIRELGYNGVVFGVTGHVLEEDVKQFVSMGADKVLAKPLSLETFASTFTYVRNRIVESAAVENCIDV